MHRHLVLLAAITWLGPLAPAARAADPRPPAGKPADQPAARAAAEGAERTEKGIRFRLPPGFAVEERWEEEQGEEGDKLHVGRKGPLEVRAEVEDGPLDCAAEIQTRPRAVKGAGGREGCEGETEAPSVMGVTVVERKGAVVAVAFHGRHLRVLAFAPDAAGALKLARQVAASAVEVRER